MIMRFLKNFGPYVAGVLIGVGFAYLVLVMVAPSHRPPVLASAPLAVEEPAAPAIPAKSEPEHATFLPAPVETPRATPPAAVTAPAPVVAAPTATAPVAAAPTASAPATATPATTCNQQNRQQYMACVWQQQQCEQRMAQATQMIQANMARCPQSGANREACLNHFKSMEQMYRAQICGQQQAAPVWR